MWKYIILLVTVANTVLLLIYNYTDREAESKRNKVLNIFETIFTGIYFLEGVIKIIAYGLFEHSRGYLRNKWNCVDLFIIIVG